MHIILFACVVIAASISSTAPTTHSSSLVLEQTVRGPLARLLRRRQAIERALVPFDSTIWSNFGGCTQTCVMSNFGQVCGSAFSAADYSQCICREHPDVENATALCVATRSPAELKKTAEGFVAECVNSGVGGSKLSFDGWLSIANVPATASSMTRTTTTSTSASVSTVKASDDKPSGDGLSQEAKVGIGVGIGVGLATIIATVAAAVWGPSWYRGLKRKGRLQSVELASVNPESYRPFNINIFNQNNSHQHRSSDTTASSQRSIR